MSEAELAMFEEALVRYGRNYCEFGMGGSTVLAARGGSFVIAVDSDERWKRTIGEHPDVANAVAEGRARLLHANLGPVSNWGYPVNEDQMKIWPSYVAGPWVAWSEAERAPGLVLVDGRFRLACAMSAAVAAPPGFRLLFHDFEAVRPSYRRVLDLFELVDLADTLAMFRLRDDATPGKALAATLATLFETL